MRLFQIGKCVHFKYGKCLFFKYENVPFFLKKKLIALKYENFAVFKYQKCAIFNYEKCVCFKYENVSFLNTKTVICMYFQIRILLTFAINGTPYPAQCWLLRVDITAPTLVINFIVPNYSTDTCY